MSRFIGGWEPARPLSSPVCSYVYQLKGAHTSNESPFYARSQLLAELPDQWKFKTLKQILEEPPPPDPPWKLFHLMADGCGTQVSSHPHGMKSYTWLQAMMEASLGMPVWGHFESRRVKTAMFFETEDPEWMVAQRVHKVATGLGIKPADCENCHFIMGHLGPFDLVAMRDQLRRVLDKYKPDVATLSTLQGLLGKRDWKEQADMQDVNALLVNLSNEYCPLSVITHSPWDKKQQRSAGSITQAANYQNLLHYEKSGNMVKVKLDSKLSGVEHFRLKIVNGQPDRIKFEWARMDGKEAIESYLSDHPDVSSSEAAKVFDCSDSYIRRLKREVPVTSKNFARNKKRNLYDKFRDDEEVN